MRAADFLLIAAEVLIVFLLNGRGVPQRWLKSARMAALLLQTVVVFSFGDGAALDVLISAGSFALYQATPFVVVPAGGMMALALYWLRRRHLHLYGVMECLFATATFFIVAETATREHLGTAATAFVGAVYVMIRGFVNISDARVQLEG